MGSAESHQADSEPTIKYDELVAAIVNDASASKHFASLGARHTVDEPSNPAVVTDSNRQATDLIVAPAAVCPGVVTRQSQSLFKDYSMQIRMQSQYGSRKPVYVTTDENNSSNGLGFW